MSYIIDGHSENGFAIIRPPGHHADEHKAQGFCLYNNVAVAVKSIQYVIYIYTIYIYIYMHTCVY